MLAVFYLNRSSVLAWTGGGGGEASMQVSVALHQRGGEGAGDGWWGVVVGHFFHGFLGFGAPHSFSSENLHIARRKCM